MINIPPTPARIYRKPKPQAAKAPAVALNLVAASVDDSPTLTLQFNQAIDISAMDVSTFVVNDGGLGFSYVGWDVPTLIDPMTVQVALNGTGDYDGPTLLTVGAGNGIVAVDDGGTWSGATDLGLPYP